MSGRRVLFRIYLLLAAVGALLPYALLLPWVARHGLDLPLLVALPFANVPARIFAADLLFAAFVFLIFAFAEGERTGLRHRWLPPAVVLLVGLCCALPLFLAQRELALMRRASSGT